MAAQQVGEARKDHGTGDAMRVGLAERHRRGQRFQAREAPPSVLVEGPTNHLALTLGYAVHRRIRIFVEVAQEGGAGRRDPAERCGIERHRFALPGHGQHRLGGDVEARCQDHRHGALLALRSDACRAGPASGGIRTRRAGRYPRRMDEDGLESGIGRALPVNSRASPICMG